MRNLLIVLALLALLLAVIAIVNGYSIIDIKAGPDIGIRLEKAFQLASQA